MAVSFKKYLKKQIKMLEEFTIFLKDDELEHLNSLKNEHDVEAYIRQILDKYLG